MNFGAGNAGVPPMMPNQGGQKKGFDAIKEKLDAKAIAVIAVVAVVLLAILIPCIAGGIKNGKIKKSVKTYVQVFYGDKKAKDVKWTRYYPKVFEKEVEKWAKGYEDYIDADDADDFKVLSITKINSDDFGDTVEDAVTEFFNYSVSSYKEVDEDDVDDLKISDAYLVITQMDDGDAKIDMWLVVKVNGRYGVYGRRTLISE